MDSDLVLPLATGAGSILLELAGSVMVFLRPSDTPCDR